MMLHVLLIATSVSISVSNAVIVNTTYGALKGAVTGNYTSFIGIPYAQPPIDDLRFAAPVELNSWNGTKDVSDVNLTIPCVQEMQYLDRIGNTTGQEDCLYLNVFTPLDANSSSSYQVMVWIHGGGFETGWSREGYDPTHWMNYIE